jgi:glycosyltransferase involved in cell wall biosynthesis
MMASTLLMARPGDFGFLAPEPEGPAVTVVIANRNNARFLPDCLSAVSAQTLSNIEIIVVDDASDDESRDVITAYADLDPRLTLLQNEQRVGPAQARNRALDAARGKWIAIVDSDDLMHPERLATLVRAAEEGDLDIVADNQILFYETHGKRAHPLLPSRASFAVTCPSYVASNSLRGGNVPLGYLKPLFRRSFIESGRFRYNRDMPIAEDYDFVFRLLAAGASFQVIPSLSYFYRRHARSTSFRLSRDALVAMLEGDAASRSSLHGEPDREVRRALDLRRKSIEETLAYTDLVGRLKARDWSGAMRQAASSPRAVLRLRELVTGRLSRLLARGQRGVEAPRRACVLSRQRVTGATNGSSAYLLGICTALRDQGWTVDLICPSPAMFGRWPFLKLKPEMDIFRSISIRGSVRVGSIVLATNPMIALRALTALADKVLSRFGRGLGSLARKAPHAIAVELTGADRLFVASKARRPSLVIADYEFLTEAIPFTMAPSARSAVVMHDLFSGQKTKDRPVIVDREQEMRLLAAADLVVAIQKEEADVVASHLGSDRVMVVPMAMQRVAHAQPGDGETVIFVGSNALPNIDAVEWLCSEIWPLVIRKVPRARLCIAGTVCQSVSSRPAGVELLGRVDSLVELYRRAAVVVSPLRSGSGLKVKLVEALAHGKAVVGTSVTFQGVEHLAGTAARREDDATLFAAAIVSFLRSEDERRSEGEKALAAAEREFSPTKSYQELLRFAEGADDPARRMRRSTPNSAVCAEATQP